jgi:hypothetical protein
MSIWNKIHNTKPNDEQTIKIESSDKINCFNGKFILSRYGVKVDINLINELKIFSTLSKYFTVKIPTITGFNIVVLNHIIDKSTGKYIFPRFGFLNYMDKYFKNLEFTNKIGLGKRPINKFVWTGEFKGNQPIIAKHIMKHILIKKMLLLVRLV